MLVNNRKRVCNIIFHYLVKPLLCIGLLTLFSTCIEEFNPKINDNEQSLVVEGSIIKGNVYQYIFISRSKPLNESQYEWVSNCDVTISDDLGNIFSFEEIGPGVYQAAIPDVNLKYNTNYTLHFTADGELYESDPEPLLRSSPLVNVYYRNEAHQSSSEYHSEGLQFYTDIEASEEYARNYRWKLLETFEYHSLQLIDGHYAKSEDKTYQNTPPVDTAYYCWSTIEIQDLFSSSTKKLTTNQKKQIPLNYVAGTDKRLFVRYSLLVRQYALSDPAYEYWNRKKVENKEGGGLYQSQPSQSKSNIHNVNNPDEIVLGFFWASSYTKKRIFFNGPLIDIPIESQKTCELIKLTGEAKESFPHNSNTYLTNISLDPKNPNWFFGLRACYDCTIYGGVTYPPDFWND